jgi:hypothetical protein
MFPQVLKQRIPLYFRKICHNCIVGVCVTAGKPGDEELKKLGSEPTARISDLFG